MKINLHMFAIVLIACITSLNDIIIYFSKLNYNISLIISIILIAILVFFLVKKKKIKIFNNFEKKDLFFLLPYILVNSMLFLICDNKTDTLNYHIYNQQSFFDDKINFDYLPNGAFFFPLGDRMSYIFRHFLGYRLGTILSFYTLIVLFYQMKSILFEIFPEITSKKRLLFSSLVLLTVSPNWRSASYHVDNFSMIFMLELIYIMIRREDIFKNKSVLYYVSLLLGISIGIKIVNIVIGATIVLIILVTSFIKNKKEVFKDLKIKDICICGILFLIPFIVYMIDNYRQTGNPIFPFFNNFFQSEYYKNVTGQDKAFGIPNLFVAFIWPIIVTIDPLQGFDFYIREPLWGMGYIVCIVNLMSRIENKDIIWKLSLTGIILSNVWAIFLNGYMRYALVLPILFYIIIASNIMDILKNLKEIKSRFLDTLTFSVLAMCLIYCVFEGSNIIKDRVIEAYYARADFDNVYENEETYEIDGVWASVAFNSAMIELIRSPETPMYNIDITRDINTEESSYSDLAQKHMITTLKKEKVYTITSDSLFQKSKLFLEQSGFQIVGEPVKYQNSKLQNRNDNWYILEIKYVR